MKNTENSETAKSVYIYSIDGLRAVAVMLVVFYHSGFLQLNGGFIGVDVFYVISGFLITQNIMKQAEAGTFSFIQFYQRRMARLLPALFTLIFIVLLCSFFILTPADLARLGQAATYSSLSFSNVFFWMEAGYFDRASEVKPLLHTWSLSVEEQFYMVWPALITLLFLLGRRMAVIYGMVILSLVSLVFALGFYKSQPAAVFFLTPFRVYQFGIGALIALTGSFGYKPYKAILVFASMLCLIVLSYRIDGSTHIFFSAISPAVLAGIFIVGSRSPSVERVFASKWFVWLGQRSYSIYLVHWPMMVLWRISSDYEFNLAEKIISIFLSIYLGYLLHLLVEKRFRFRSSFSPETRHGIITLTLIMLVANLIVASHWWGKDGYPERVPENLRIYAQNLNPQWKARKKMVRDGICNLSINEYTSESAFNIDKCLSIDSKKSNWMILGDSFASGTYPIFKRSFPSVNFQQLTIPGCGLQPPNRITGETMCAKLQRKIYRYIEETPELDGVVISSNWRDGHIYVAEETVDVLQSFGKKVVLVNQRIAFRDRIPVIVSSAMSMARAEAKANALMKTENIEINNKIKEKLQERVSIVDMISLQCPEDCTIFDEDDNLIYLDDAHFSPEGIKYISKRLTTSYGDLLN